VHEAALMDVHHPACSIMQHLHAELPRQVLQVLQTGKYNGSNDTRCLSA
jgi:hypothetical protein